MRREGAKHSRGIQHGTQRRQNCQQQMTEGCKQAGVQTWAGRRIKQTCLCGLGLIWHGKGGADDIVGGGVVT